jgi:prepilin-type N-terminal cleavage/methylation domain-containing protein
MRNLGFTLIEMAISTAIFVAGAVYVYGTFAGVTASTATSTVQIDLSSQNKGALTRLYTELQATSLSSHDLDGTGVEQPVFLVSGDTGSPAPETKPRLVLRTTANPDQADATWQLGEGKQQAREKAILQNSRLRFRKVIGYRFNAGAGTIEPEWSAEITYEVNALHQLVRRVSGAGPKVVANRVDAFTVEPKPDGTVVVTLVTARRSPTGDGFRRYCNAVTVHPKN